MPVQVSSDLRLFLYLMKKNGKETYTLEIPRKSNIILFGRKMSACCENIVEIEKGNTREHRAVAGTHATHL
jgi:hypothetical protein